MLFIVGESDGTHPLMHPAWVPLCDALHLSVPVVGFSAGWVGRAVVIGRACVSSGKRRETDVDEVSRKGEKRRKTER